MSKTESYVSLMIDSLDKKLQVLRVIDELNECQQEMLQTADMDMDDFEDNVQQKSAQIELLAELDSGFTSLYNRVKEALDTDRKSYGKEIELMKKYIREITDFSVKIEADEKRNQILADQKFNTLKQEIKEAKRSTQTASKYYKSMSRVEDEPQFFDTKH